eukprot:695426_1
MRGNGGGHDEKHETEHKSNENKPLQHKNSNKKSSHTQQFTNTKGLSDDTLYRCENARCNSNTIIHQTITLSNRYNSTDKSPPPPQHCIFQCNPNGNSNVIDN